jgi:hypothetical protein
MDTLDSLLNTSGMIDPHSVLSLLSVAFKIGRFAYKTVKARRSEKDSAGSSSQKSSSRGLHRNSSPQNVHSGSEIFSGSYHVCDVCDKVTSDETGLLRCEFDLNHMRTTIRLIRLVTGSVCAYYESCEACFPNIRHERHIFVKIPEDGPPEVVMNGMPHAICKGCGVGVRGQSWMCRSFCPQIYITACAYSDAGAACHINTFVLCNMCLPSSHHLHDPEHFFIRYSSNRDPASSSPLQCSGCHETVMGLLWECESFS